MLFNSYVFLFAFLPLALAGYQVAAHWHRRAVVLWLALISLAFYGYWRPAFLVLLCGSILFNYSAGLLISRRISTTFSTRLILWVAIAGNLGALCFFKYLFPSLNAIAHLLRQPTRWSDVVLPLGISFFTFTQIAYLVDLEQGAAKQQDLGSYALFVTFFPHLIAGPILHHSEIMPQFQKERDFRLRLDDIAVGAAWFVMGLAKKILIADRFAPDADAAFFNPHALHTSAAWAGVFAYALQLYFDFSGYSDMALGLARMFSIDFPLNFSSPYKAKSIIDFWQRWHMTLTRYIMSYLYNPVSLWVNRRRVRQGKKVTRKATATPGGFLSMVAVPTTVTLFLAGLWHGAGLQFIIFGLLHSFYLCVNHGWRAWRLLHPAKSRAPLAAKLLATSSVITTFLAVVVAQVFFRSTSVRSACSMLAGMLGRHHGFVPGPFHPGPGTLARLLAGFFVVWALPNTQQLLANFRPSLGLAPSDLVPAAVSLRWLPSFAWGAGLGIALLLTLVKMQDSYAFLYFQF